MKTVLIYIDTNKDVGDVDHLKVFASEESALSRGGAPSVFDDTDATFSTPVTAIRLTMNALSSVGGKVTARRSCRQASHDGRRRRRIS